MEEILHNTSGDELYNGLLEDDFESLVPGMEVPRTLVYRHPEIFDIAYPGHPGDAAFYAKKTQDADDGLYLGVGTGRIYGEVFDSNHNILGIDNCHEMIATLFKRFPQIPEDNIIEASILDYKMPRSSFDTIIAPYSFLTQFEEDDVMKILAQVRKGLGSKGVFITDMFSPYLNPPAKQRRESESSVQPDGTMIDIQRVYDHARQKILEITNVQNGSLKLAFELNLSYYHPREVERMIKDACLRIRSMWGDFNGTKFRPESSPAMVYCIDKPDYITFSFPPPNGK